MSVKDFEKMRFESAVASEKMPFIQVLSTGMLKISRNFELPFLFLCLLGPARLNFLSAPAELALSIFSVSCLLGALLLRLWSKGYSKNEKFVIDGPYRYVRNPVEISTIFAFIGVAWILALEFWYVGLCLLLSFFWMSFVSNAAERQLYLSLGPTFLKYKKRVRRWIPSLLPEFNRGGSMFSFRRSLKEERSVLLWVCIVAAIYAVRLGVWRP